MTNREHAEALVGMLGETLLAVIAALDEVSDAELREALKDLRSVSAGSAASLRQWMAAHAE